MRIIFFLKPSIKIGNIVKRLIYSFVCFLVISTSSVRAQEMFGLSLGNYSGVNSIIANPAMLTHQHNFVDVNIIGADIFVNNNFAYIPGADYNMWDAVRIKPLPAYEDGNNFLYYKNEDLKSMATNVRVLGPSAMMQYGKHAFGFSTALRVFAAGTGVPWEMPVFGYEGMSYTPLQNIQFNDYNMDLQANVWGEIGLSYAYDAYHFLDNQVTVGISVKYLLGYSGAYGDISNVEYMVQNDSVINITNLDAEVGFALPIDYNNSDFPDSGPTFKGSGLGIDIGAVFVKRKNIDDKRWRRPCEQRYEDYVYRIGVSILDIGRINYKNNAQLHTFENVGVLWQNYDTVSFDNVNQVVGEMSNLFYGDPDASLKGNSIKVGLPTALSVQADYHFKDNIFFGAYWIQPIRFNGHTMRRPAQVAIIPRYETKYVEFSLPISLYEYQYPRVGAALRLYFLTIGTERLGTWLGAGNLDGMDIYFSLKLGLEKGRCKPKSHNDCYNLEYGYSDKQKLKFKKRRR